MSRMQEETSVLRDVDEECEEYGSEEEDELINKDQDKDDNKKKTSNLQTLWNIMNLIQGMGVLGVPYAIRIGGFMVIPDIIFVGLLANYTSKAIVACQYNDVTDDDVTNGTNPKVRRGYAAIGQEVWKTHGSRIISITQLIHLFGACVLYLLLISNLIEDCFLDVMGSRYMCMITSGTLLIPTVFINNMKQISYLSMISVCLIDVTFLILTIHSLIDFHLWRVTDIMVFDFQGFSIAHSIVLFSFVAHPYLPRIEDGMKTQSNYNKISDLSFLFATLVKILFGSALAFRYGVNTKQKISENLEIDAMRKVMGGCLAFVGYHSYPMPAAVITSIIERANIQQLHKIFPLTRLNKVMSWSEKYLDIGIRTILLAFTVLVAILISEFSLLMAVFGSCTAMLLTVVFPVWFYQYLKIGVNKHLSYFIICYGIISGVIGFTNSMMKLQEAKEKNET